MAEETTSALVLADENGDYYVIPVDALKQMRIPAEQRAEIESAVEGDASGFLMNLAEKNALSFSEKVSFGEKSPLISEKLGGAVLGGYMLLGTVQVVRR